MENSPRALPNRCVALYVSIAGRCLPFNGVHGQFGESLERGQLSQPVRWSHSAM